jgi:hypothetical protein
VYGQTSAPISTSFSSVTTSSSRRGPLSWPSLSTTDGRRRRRLVATRQISCVETGLGLDLESLQCVRPHVGEERPQLGHPFGSGPIETARPISPFHDETGLLENGQVLTDGRASHGEVRRDLAGGHLVEGHEPEDGAPVRLGDGAQDVVRFGASDSQPIRPIVRPSGSANRANEP